MKSQLELLRDRVLELERNYGLDNPLVKGIKEQIVGLENQQYRAEEREKLSRLISSQRNPPSHHELEASSLYERLISQLPPAVAKDNTHQKLPPSPKNPIKNSAK